MSIQLLCVSHKTADTKRRGLFAFDDDAKARIMERLISSPYINEAVLLATCNRTELYCEVREKTETAVLFMQQVLLEEAGVSENSEIQDVILRYEEKKAVHHLFMVAAGLDSVVLGEDQILGQVKNAYLASDKKGYIGNSFHSLFQVAMAAAKKVKTDTPMSKTSVSTASLALKQAGEEFGTLSGKNIMIIGASGKIGNIVMLDALDIEGANVYVTARNHIPEKNARCNIIDYKDRYEHMEKMDVIISATSSPHYTVTRKHFEEKEHKNKVVFIDLAVPFDISPDIEKIQGVARYSMEDMNRLAAKNNELKKSYLCDAKEIIREYEQEYLKNEIFRANREKIDGFMAYIKENAEKKSLDAAVHKMIFDIKEKSNAQEFQDFVEIIAKIQWYC
ncbi:MAG: glutamyl-tRNA reductase [Butyribacter sp.]|nr:glutamyl-tRNA reductase [Clostridium sp.]MCQ5166049.1 glutamyl-tRNA reductase [Roseburia hominis]